MTSFQKEDYVARVLASRLSSLLATTGLEDTDITNILRRLVVLLDIQVNQFAIVNNDHEDDGA